ncbi:MAG: HEAT repeat domain-containing protein [Sedimentisphaerales bacterium]|nr:HEAT repeat domain-containing protein [Sedimentisphaerales bacterium]
MTTWQRLFFGSMVLLVFMTGGLAVGANESQKIDELISKLGQRDFQNVVDALVQIGDPAVKPLIRTLQDRSIKTWIIHAKVVNVLAKIGSQQAVEAVVKSLSDAGLNPYVRGSVALTIAEIRPKEAAVILSRVSKDESQFVRWKCVQALGRLGDKEGAAALIRALSDEDQYVRAASARSLGQIKAENAAGSLIDALKDESWIVRLNAREALLQISEAADGCLITTLKDKHSGTRWQAAWVLGKIECEKAIEPLVEALADDDWMVSDEAAVALTRISSEKVIKALIDARINRDDHVREQAAWIVSQIKTNRVVKEEPNQVETSEKKLPERIYCGQKEYPCYPATLDAKPDIPSPHTTLDGIQVVTAFTKDGKYAIVPVTVENGRPLNYEQNQLGKGRQLEIDAGDFPTLARTGLHSETELNRTKIITGRSIVEIIDLGRPGRSSGAGFMSDDEDIISVIKGDNSLIERLGLKHPQMAKPLFHIWNMILRDVELNRMGRLREPFEYVCYNGQKVLVKAEGTKGWQESIFDDEIQGMFQIEIWREPDQNDKTFLRKKYPDLTEDQMAGLLKKLSHIFSGEMVPYYIMRYGFYEGHTEYRADPIAIAWIFGKRNLEQIEAAFPGRLDEVMTQHFTRQVMIQN